MIMVSSMMLSRLPNKENNGLLNPNSEKILNNSIKSLNLKKSTYKNYCILKKSTCKKEKNGKYQKSLMVKTYLSSKIMSR